KFACEFVCLHVSELRIMPFQANSKPEATSPLPVGERVRVRGLSLHPASADHTSGGLAVLRARSKTFLFRAISMHAGSSWTYAPRPCAWRDRSTAAAPSAVRTTRIRPALPASPRQPTHVRTG